jgi:hypothetical protein
MVFHAQHGSHGALEVDAGHAADHGGDHVDHGLALIAEDPIDRVDVVEQLAECWHDDHRLRVCGDMIQRLRGAGDRGQRHEGGERTTEHRTGETECRTLHVWVSFRRVHTDPIRAG